MTPMLEGNRISLGDTVSGISVSQPPEQVSRRRHNLMPMLEGKHISLDDTVSGISVSQQPEHRCLVADTI